MNCDLIATEYHSSSIQLGRNRLAICCPGIHIQKKIRLTLQQVQLMFGTTDKLDKTLEDLWLAIKTLGPTNDLSEFLSSQQLEGVHIAAIYLSAGVMDCLTLLVDRVTPVNLMSGLQKAVDPPDIDSELIIIRGRVQFYATELTKITQNIQLKVIRNTQDEVILDWVWPKGRELKIKDRDSVAETCCWFFETDQYKNWVGPGSGTALICSGKGNFAS